MATINTIVDDFDVLKVMLREKPGDEKGKPVTSLLKDTHVIINRSEDEYVQVSVVNEDGETLTGWCLNDFVHDKSQKT